jgi:hypothetical protein
VDHVVLASDARDYEDTLLDLALGTLGGALFAAIWWRAPAEAPETA